jgi:hypothetical protein
MVIKNMDKKVINKLISKDQLKDAMDMLSSEELNKSKAQLLKLIRGRLINLERERMEGVLDAGDYTIRRNRIRKDLLEFIDFSLSDHLPINFIKAILQEHNFKMKIQELECSEKVNHKKILAVLGRLYNWTVKLPVEIENKNIDIQFNPLSKNLEVLVPKIFLSSHYTVTNQSAETIEEETQLWSEEIAWDGKFWQQINRITQEQLNEKIKNEPLFVSSLIDQAVKCVQEKILKIVSAEELGDVRLDVKIQSIEGYYDLKKVL